MSLFNSYILIEEKMNKKSKTVNEISHEEINDALTRFLKEGGVIKKVEYNDNGFLLNNDLALDDNYAEAADKIITQLNVDFEPENRI
tara:strand:+ start:675 stop:935 length:261 start_codon:yes stop_codon:yes gene_type:complete